MRDPLQETGKLNIARERFIKFVVEGFRDVTNLDLQTRANKLGIENWGPLFSVVQISLHVDIYPVEHLDHALIDIEEMVHTFLEMRGWNCWTYVDSRNSIIAVLSCNQMDVYKKLDVAIAELIKKLMDEFGILIYAGIGGIVSNSAEIKRSAEEAGMCIAYKYTLAKDNVINIKNVRRVLSNGSVASATAFERVVGCFLDGDLQKLNLRLNELLNLVGKSGANLQLIKQVYLELITQIMHCVADAGIELDEEETSEFLRYVLREDNLQSIKGGFLEKCSFFIQEMNEKRKKSTMYIAEMAKKLIERNYADVELSQQSVSDSLGLSVGYFGQLFFLQTGQRFVDYLHQYRIEMAKNRLAMTKDKVKDVSIAVGIANINYFNALFKKRVGMTPVEFRRKNLV